MSNISDPIADMLTRIRNAIKTGHIKVDIPSSKIKVSLTKILKDEFLSNISKIEQVELRESSIEIANYFSRNFSKKVVDGNEK